MSGKIPIPLSVGARQMLSQVRRTGTFAGMKASTGDVKDAYRLLYTKYGPNEADRFATGWRGESFDASSVLQDAKYGFDEISYPRGTERLPKGALNDDARRAARAAAIRARRKGTKREMR